MPLKKPHLLVLLLMAFLVPVCIYGAVMFAAGITPFGDNTLLMWDANNQNTAFMSWWQQVLSGEADTLYSFERMLGSEMIGLIAFYLASPLNLLLLLPFEFPLTYSVLTLVKIGLCGLTMMIFLRRQKWSSLFFSTTYALSGFMAAYCFRAAWLDGMILLPLVALGILHIHEGRKPFLYILSLALALLSQYYFGYMLCVFSLLYFLYHFRWRQWRAAVRFAVASMLAAGLAAVILIPVYLTISQGYSLSANGLLTLERVNTLEHLFTKIYTASVSVVQLKSNSPNYYVGIPMLVFVALYFMNGAVPLRRRVRSLVFVLIFVVSFWIAAPYYAWHGFDGPNYYPARFSFLFSFLLIILGQEGLDAMRAPKKRLIAIAAAFAAMTFLLFRTLTVEYLAYKTIFFDVAVCTLTCGLLFWGKRRRLCLWLIILMQFAGLFLNSYYAYRRLSAVYTVTESEYLEETEETQALVDRVLADDDSVYRMEKDFRRNDNDPLLYGYRGLSHMSSDLDQGFMNFCVQVGLFQGNYHLAYRSGTTPVLESLLGVKYILRKDGIAMEDLPEGYEALWEDGDVTAYENTYALSLAYLVPEQTLELSDANPFINQNYLLSDLTGETVLVFEPIYSIDRDYDGEWETYTFEVEAGRQLYLYSYGGDYILNGEEKDDGNMSGTVLLPVAQDDSTYELQMTKPLGIDLAYFDLEAFQEAYAILAEYTVEVTSDTDSHLVIEAEVTDDHTQLLITLPYDAGWQAWVDGERVETTSRYDALLAVDLTEGSHTVELIFRPSGLSTGAFISLLSLISTIVWMIMRHRKAKKNHKN